MHIRVSSKQHKGPVRLIYLFWGARVGIIRLFPMVRHKPLCCKLFLKVKIHVKRRERERERERERYYKHFTITLTIN